MTKEELKQEAEELIQRFEMANSMNCFMQLTPDRKQIGEMLVMIAEPREKRIEQLEKENAELKADNDARKFAMSMSEKVEKQLRNERNTFLAQNEQYEKDLIDFNENLTKAKELLKEFVHHYKNKTIYIENMQDLLEQAEQFLSEVEKC